MKITFSVLGRLLGAALVLAINPSVTQAQFVGPTAITINGTFTDWTGNVYSQTDGSNAGANAGTPNDLTQFWYAMSTASGGTSPAGPLNLIQNVYFRFDTAETGSGNPKQVYLVQLNLGTAGAGFADHLLHFYVDTSATGNPGDPKVAIVLKQYSGTYPAMGAFTTGLETEKVSNKSGVAPVTDENATGSWALNGTTYSLEAKIPIGWYSGAYGGAITNDGTGASLIASAVFTAPGSLGAVASVKDVLDDASGNTYNSQVSATTGSVSFVPNHAGGTAYSATAAAATLTPVAGAGDTITLTVKNSDGTTTDTTFSGTKSVTISGDTVAPNGSYGSFNGVTLTGSPQTISVTFASGVATPSLILNKAATQTIGFSLPDLTYPAANNLTITPTAATASQLVVTTQPSASTVAGVVFATQPVVKIEDQYGNVVTSGADASVSVALTKTTGTGTLGGTTSMSAVNGVADFSGKGLNINLVGTDKVLTATATVTAGAKTTTTSPVFAITLPPISILRGPGAGVKIHVSGDLLTPDATWDSYASQAYGSCDSTTANSISLAISGSGSSTLIVYPSSAANTADSFQYTITDSNGTRTGTVNIIITTTLTGQAGTISVSGGHATMTFYGVPGYHYAVQRATDLSGQGNWADITVTSSNASVDNGLGYSVVTAPSGGAFTVTDGSAPGSSAYYRLRATP